MKELTERGKKLSTEERNLLSVAYKNVIGSHRSQWRVVSSLEEKTEDAIKKSQIKEDLAIVQTEINQICKEVLVSLTVSSYDGYRTI